MRRPGARNGRVRFLSAMVVATAHRLLTALEGEIATQIFTNQLEPDVEVVKPAPEAPASRIVKRGRSAFNDRIQRQGPLGPLDISAEFGPAHRHWSVLAYGCNFTNEPYITGSNSAPLPAIGVFKLTDDQFDARVPPPLKPIRLSQP